jgi:ankyrin repeat protein
MSLLTFLFGPGSINLAQRAREGNLTIEEVTTTTKEKLEDDKQYGCTALYFASRKCPVEVVEAILDKEVDINGLSEYGDWTALIAASNYSKWNTVHLLVRRGANATLLDTYKRSALHYAANNGAPNDVIIVLIDAGANKKAKDYQRKTPADLARENNYIATAEFIDQYFMAPIKSANLMI